MGQAALVSADSGQTSRSASSQLVSLAVKTAGLGTTQRQERHTLRPDQDGVRRLVQKRSPRGVTEAAWFSSKPPAHKSGSAGSLFVSLSKQGLFRQACTVVLHRPDHCRLGPTVQSDAAVESSPCAAFTKGLDALKQARGRPRGISACSHK